MYDALPIPPLAPVDPTPPTAPPWFPVGEDSVRLLRDGAQAFPAMLAAIAGAQHEVCLLYTSRCV